MRLKKYLNENDKMKVYFDMDGVLTDFKGAFKKLGGRTTEEVDREGDEAFWDYVEKGGLKFWSDMPWLKGSKKLWNYIKNSGINVSILSAPAKILPDSSKGKKIWINRELGPIKTILVRARDKQKYANKNSILIDDMENNIQQWKAAGGIGILFKSAEQAIKELKKLGV